MTTLNDHSSTSDSSLSAMFDGEASEQDIDVLLQQDSDDIQRKLTNYHLIQRTLQKQAISDASLESSLLGNIWEQIEREDNAQKPEASDNVVPLSSMQEVQGKNSWKVMFSSMAIAASVAFLIVFSGQVLLPSDISDNNFTASIESLDSIDIETSIAELEVESNIVPSDNLRLQHYLRQHAEQSAFAVGQGMIPMARVVSYPVEE